MRTRIVPWSAALLLLAGCSGGGGSDSPMVEVKKQVGRQWEEMQEVLNEQGPVAAQGRATAIAALLRDPAVTQDPRFAADTSYQNMNATMIDMLEKLDLHISEGSLPDVLASLDQAANQCKRCHRLHRKR